MKYDSFLGWTEGQWASAFAQYYVTFEVDGLLAAHRLRKLYVEQFGRDPPYGYAATPRSRERARRLFVLAGTAIEDWSWLRVEPVCV